MNEPQGEVERDDAIVGQAFVWSGGLLLVLIAIGVGVALWMRSQKPVVVEVKTELDKPKVRETRVAEVPAMPFADFTGELVPVDLGHAPSRGPADDGALSQRG